MIISLESKDGIFTGAHKQNVSVSSQSHMLTILLSLYYTHIIKHISLISIPTSRTNIGSSLVWLQFIWVEKIGLILNMINVKNKISNIIRPKLDSIIEIMDTSYKYSCNLRPSLHNLFFRSNI